MPSKVHARGAGLHGAAIAIEDIGLSEDGRFTDLDDRVIGSLFKLYPLEDLMQEDFGSALPGSGVQLRSGAHWFGLGGRFASV